MYKWFYTLQYNLYRNAIFNKFLSSNNEIIILNNHEINVNVSNLLLKKKKKQCLI